MNTLQQGWQGDVGECSNQHVDDQLIICGTGFYGEEREIVRQQSAALGIRYSGHFTKGLCNILVSRDDFHDSEKVVKAKQWGIPVVSYNWISNSLRNGRPLDPQAFIVQPCQETNDNRENIRNSQQKHNLMIDSASKGNIEEHYPKKLPHPTFSAAQASINNSSLQNQTPIKVNLQNKLFNVAENDANSDFCSTPNACLQTGLMFPNSAASNSQSPSRNSSRPALQDKNHYQFQKEQTPPAETQNDRHKKQKRSDAGREYRRSPTLDIKTAAIEIKEEDETNETVKLWRDNDVFGVQNAAESDQSSSWCSYKNQKESEETTETDDGNVLDVSDQIVEDTEASDRPHEQKQKERKKKLFKVQDYQPMSQSRLPCSVDAVAQLLNTVDSSRNSDSDDWHAVVQMKRYPKLTTAKEVHELDSLKRVLFAEIIENTKYSLQFNTKDKRLAALLCLPPNPTIKSSNQAERSTAAGDSAQLSGLSLYEPMSVNNQQQKVVLAEVQAFYQLPTGHWWLEFSRFLSTSQLTAKHVQYPQDTDCRREVFKCLLREHCPAEYVIGNCYLRQCKSQTAPKMKPLDHTVFWRYGVNMEQAKVVTDKPASDFIA